MIIAAAVAAGPQHAPSDSQIAAPIQTPAAVAPPAPDESHDGVLGLLSVLDADFELGPWKIRGIFPIRFRQLRSAPPQPPETDFRRGPPGEEGLDARELTDGALLRRARLGAQGTWGRDVAYRAMFELSQESAPRVAEVWVSYNRFKPYAIQVGAFPPPANMEDATSSDNTLFMERATAANLARSFGRGRRAHWRHRSPLQPTRHAAVSLTGPVLDHAKDYSPRSAIVARVLQRVSHTPVSSFYLGLSSNWVLAPSEKRTSATRPLQPMRLEARLKSSSTTHH